MINATKFLNKKTTCTLLLNFGENIDDSFICSDCGRSFGRKYSLTRHELYFCRSKIYMKNDSKIIEVIQKSNDNINSLNQKHINNINSDIEETHMLQTSTDVAHNHQQSTIKIKKDYICEFCKLNFSRSDSLKRHLNGRCKEKNKKESDQIIIQQLLEEMYSKIQNIEKENSELKNELSSIKNNNIPNTINSNNNIQNNNTLINNNINIVAFGKEKLDEIVSDAVCKKILFKGFEAVPKLIEYIRTCP